MGRTWREKVLENIISTLDINLEGDGWDELWTRSTLTLSIRELKDPLLSLLSADISTQALFDLYASGIVLLDGFQDTNVGEIELEASPSAARVAEALDTSTLLKESIENALDTGLSPTDPSI